jgi:ribosomal protein S18 acetylase RimI-like enzyme
VGSYIRYAGIKDAGIIGFIHSESCKQTYKGIIPDYVLQRITPKQRAGYFYRALLTRTQEIAIMYKDGKPAGFIALRKRGFKELGDVDKQMQIYRIYFLPGFWHKGFGTELLNWSFDELKKRGYEKVNLWVFKDNLNARRCYEKLGFNHDGAIIRSSYGRNIYLIRYFKDISQ